MLRCPLYDSMQYMDDVAALIYQCTLAKCSFVDSDLDTDYMPAGCALLVAGLLASKRETEVIPRKEGD